MNSSRYSPDQYNRKSFIKISDRSAYKETFTLYSLITHMFVVQLEAINSHH